jgi:hypothetical protein
VNVKHQDLDQVGRRTHRDIDARLPTLQEKETLRNLALNAELELVADGNVGFDEDGNWRIRIDSSGNLVIEVRSSGSWVEQASWEG